MAEKTLRDAIEEKTGVISTPTSVHKFHTLIADKFPVNMWKEWKSSCKEQYNNKYWHKIWTDHLKAQTYDAIVSGNAILKPENNIDEKDKKKEDVIPMIGDGGN